MPTALQTVTAAAHQGAQDHCQRHHLVTRSGHYDVCKMQCLDSASDLRTPWQIPSDQIQQDGFCNIVSIVSGGNLISFLKNTTAVESLAPVGNIWARDWWKASQACTGR